MSEEDSNHSREESEENEEEEKEENENEEEEEGGEEEEKEEEEEEKEEEESEEKEEESTSNNQKKKEQPQEKFEEKKLVIQSSESKAEPSPTQSNEVITVADIPKSKDIFTIISEVNAEMDSLSSELDATFSRIETKNDDKDSDNLKDLLSKASELTKQLDLQIEDTEKIIGNKAIQSNEEEVKRDPKGEPPQISTSPYDLYSNPIYPRKEQFQPYDPNKNKQYYSSLAMNNNNNFLRGYSNSSNLTQPPLGYGSNRYQTSRLKRMDELYQGGGFGSKMPIIYSQSEVGSSQSLRGESLPNNEFNENMRKKYQDYLPNISSQNNRFNHFEQN